MLFIIIAKVGLFAQLAKSKFETRIITPFRWYIC